jgi:uncharacterized protein
MGSLEYPVISSDSHVLEPHDLWQRYASKQYADRVPRLVHEETTDRIVCEGAALVPVGLLAGCMRSDEEVRVEGRWDEDVPRSGYDPEARIADMERDGVAAEVVFPTVAMHFYPIEDAAFQGELFRAYNTWVADFCKAQPARLKGIGMLNHEDVDAAVAELTRCKEMGLSGVMVPLFTAEETPLHDRRFDRLWQAAQDMQMPVNLHSNTMRRRANAWTEGTGVDRLVNRIHQIQHVILDLIVYGTFDRFPGLMVVSAENDAGWAAHMLERVDFQWRRNRNFLASAETACKRMPSSYYHSNVRATFMRDRAALLARDIIGPETLMWGSDFPHHVSTWPNSHAEIDAQFRDVDAAVRDQVVYGNVRALYGFAS